ncbi:hypothetical protein [Streptomyces hesseae]|uniref:Transposase n=1 Tax=Streptomyces hesseae TaxID=3075519 RepID=A0ABU2SXN8_9ACTN|nr:hypothetical protein [Streptomyces sp. DSM 40473]MDT0453767.1 hypothetical protein [Streptomyces sp. DSM 40473]
MAASFAERSRRRSSGALRNFAISTIHRAGHRSIAAALRHLSYQTRIRPLDLIGLP